MTESVSHPPAREPNDLGQFFIWRANAGDVEGLVALYEPDAVLAFPPGQLAVGTEAIRAAFQEMLASQAPVPAGRTATSASSR